MQRISTVASAQVRGGISIVAGAFAFTLTACSSPEDELGGDEADSAEDGSSTADGDGAEDGHTSDSDGTTGEDATGGDGGSAADDEGTEEGDATGDDGVTEDSGTDDGGTDDGGTDDGGTDDGGTDDGGTDDGGTDDGGTDDGGTDDGGEGTCNDGLQNQGEEGVDCGGPCLPCSYPDGRSIKRGAAYNFCDWDFSEGQQDLVLLKDGTAAGSGLTWYYNWGVSPGDCISSSPDLNHTVEFVPMAWGLIEEGAGCSTGERCFSGGLSRDDFLARVPEASRFLLGFNEPNFQNQSGLTPTIAAQGWTHLEYVADVRDLELVGPAVNFCDPSMDSDHAGSCTREADEKTFVFAAYEESFPAGYRYNVFEWAELFYDECSSVGAAGHDCRIDYQAGHVYSYWGLDWFIVMFKRKAGLEPPDAEHCTNGMEDADEFGVDCGGQDCRACSEWAREQFAKSLWITEFAPSTDDAGGSPSWDERIMRTLEYIETQVPVLEADSYVFRYAWFMPKTDIASLDHVDLLTESAPLERTSVGIAYLDEPHS